MKSHIDSRPTLLARTVPPARSPLAEEAAVSDPALVRLVLVGLVTAAIGLAFLVLALAVHAAVVS